MAKASKRVIVRLNTMEVEAVVSQAVHSVSTSPVT
jgi:hypothetical protein